MPELSTVALRPEVSVGEVDTVVDSLQEALSQKLGKIGSYSGYFGKYEILGVLEQELYQLKKAINEEHLGIKPVKNELMDIAVACILGVASIRTGLVK